MGAGEDTDVANSFLLGCEGLVSGESALGQTGLGVAAAAVQLILIMMVGDSPQTARATSGARTMEAVIDWALLSVTLSQCPPRPPFWRLLGAEASEVTKPYMG